MDGISFAVFNRPDTPSWVAQCIEYDIAAQGATDLEAIVELLALILRYTKEREGGLEGLPPAPDIYRDQFEAATAKKLIPSVAFAEVCVA